MSAHDEKTVGEDEADRPRDRKRTQRKPLPLWQETIILLVTALVLAVVVKTFFVQAFYIPSGSMEPTLMINDRILVEKVSYWTGDVHRGDVVVFDDPGGWLDPSQSQQPHNALQRALEIFGLFPTGGHLVKRVIGVGGDHVRCCDKQGHLQVNGVPLKEPYLMDQKATADEHFDVQVPKRHLWVMGDNRGNSADSRAHMGDPGGGFIPVEDVIGRAWLLVWPWDRIESFDGPKTFDNPALDEPAPAAATATP
ncbi:MAG: signal peptidase I [Nocardioidaceae bacterium]